MVPYLVGWLPAPGGGGGQPAYTFDYIKLAVMDVHAARYTKLKSAGAPKVPGPSLLQLPPGPARSCGLMYVLFARGRLTGASMWITSPRQQ